MPRHVHAIIIAALVQRAAAWLPPPRLKPLASTRAPTDATSTDGLAGGLEALNQRSEYEAAFMRLVTLPLKTPPGESDAAAGGFGTKAPKKKNKKKTKKNGAAAIAARALDRDGVVRLDGALAAETAEALRADVLARRDCAHDGDGEDFADVLSKKPVTASARWRLLDGVCSMAWRSMIT